MVWVVFKAFFFPKSVLHLSPALVLQCPASAFCMESKLVRGGRGAALFMLVRACVDSQNEDVTGACTPAINLVNKQYSRESCRYSGVTVSYPSL